MIIKIKNFLQIVNHKLKIDDGISLIMSILVMGTIIVIGVTVSKIFSGEVKTTRLFEQSSMAFYAADSGAEAMLFNQRKEVSPLGNGTYECSTTPGLNLTFGPNSGLSCKVEVKTSSGTNIKSNGFFQFDPSTNTNKAQRKVEINF